MLSDFEKLAHAERVMFNGERTTIEDIKAAGWHVESPSGGNWYWRHKATG